MSERVFSDQHPLLGKVYSHQVGDQMVITTAFRPIDVRPSNILARVEPWSGPSRTRPSDYEKIIADNMAFAMNLERGQI